MRPLVAMLVVLAAGAARADLEPGHVVDTRASKTQREAARVASEAAQALTQGDFAGAISLADKSIAVDANTAWAHYVRGESLVRTSKVDDAIAELRIAESAFPANERWSKSIAIWARANAYYQLGRCTEAKTAFNEYIAFVRADDKNAVEMAQTHIDGCKGPWVPPATVTPPSTHQ